MKRWEHFDVLEAVIIPTYQEALGFKFKRLKAEYNQNWNNDQILNFLNQKFVDDRIKFEITPVVGNKRRSIYGGRFNTENFWITIEVDADFKSWLDRDWFKVATVFKEVVSNCNRTWSNDETIQIF